MILLSLMLALAAHDEDTPFCQLPSCSPWIWPLSGDVYEPRPLFSTHGQLELGMNPNGVDSPNLVSVHHSGIDIPASVGEEVRASIDGFVSTKFFKGLGNYYNYVVIKPRRGSDWGLAYIHLGEICVLQGQAVSRGQLLGTVADYPSQEHYRHLHLSIVETCDLTACCKTPHCTLVESNPLPYLSARADLSAPEFPMPAAYAGEDPATWPRILFFQGWEGFEPTEAVPPVAVTNPDLVELQTGKIAMSVRVWDFFPAGSGGTLEYLRVMPQRITVTVRHWPKLILIDSGMFQVVSEVAYCNAVELRGPLPDGTGKNLYRNDDEVGSQADESVHDFYFDLCSTPEAKGYWETGSGPDAVGLYSVEVTAEDAAGNLARTDCVIQLKNP